MISGEPPLAFNIIPNEIQKSLEMNKNQYILEFDEYKDINIGEFIQKLKELSGIPLNELKIKDLTYSSDEGLLEGGHGIYIFKKGDEIILVGKARTVSFTERIGGHFDIRPNAWFNRLLFLIVREKFEIDLKETDEKTKDEKFKDASKYAFNNLSLILINMKDPSKIDMFENVLRSTAEPLNKFKWKRGNLNLKLKEV